MKVYNREKTQILENYDLTKGYLKEEQKSIFNPEIKEVKEVGHYEVLKTYENGGKELQWVVDVKGQEYYPSYTETQKIQVYIPYTQEELNKLEYKKQINELKKYLSETDYIANKLAEATAKFTITNDLSEIRELLSKYDTVLINRKNYRQQISVLELSL